MAALQPHYVISINSCGQADVFTTIVAVLNNLYMHNCRCPRVAEKTVRWFAKRVFDDWDTDKPIPAPRDDMPPPLPLDQCRLRLRTILRDSPPLIPGTDASTAAPLVSPAHRFEGQPAFLNIFIQEHPLRFGYGFVWTDIQGGELPWLDVKPDPELNFRHAFSMVQMNYDRNEDKCVMDWNTDRAIYWARQRLLNFANELNSIVTYANGNRYQCTDEFVHPLQRTLLCRRVIEELHGVLEYKETEFVCGTASWGWLEPITDED